MSWDVFISHAGEDKTSIARPLTELLERAGIKVWLDANELTLGDSLSRRIEEGLARSTYGVVILSEHFFRKSWPAHELAGLVAKQIGGRKVILPVWHNIDRSYVLHYSPTLADALAVSTDQGLEHVADEIIRAVRSQSGVAIGEAPRHRRSKRRWITAVGSLCAIMLITVGVTLYWNSRRKQGAQTPDENDNRVLFWRRNRGPMTGYIVASCSTCSRPRAWAFYLPARKGGSFDEPEPVKAFRRRTESWPMTEFLYPEDKPGIGFCVDFPAGVCQAPYDNYRWKQVHQLQKSKPRAPKLRLDLRLLISGFELGVTNEGEALARGINVDVEAWQPGSPGVEFYKAYTVRDLSRLADFTIMGVFGDLQ